MIINRDGVAWTRLRHTFGFALDTATRGRSGERVAVEDQVHLADLFESSILPTPTRQQVASARGGDEAIQVVLAGGIAETQDMVDFCARNKIAPEIVEISMSGIDAVQERVNAKQARYRFAIDGGG